MYAVVVEQEIDVMMMMRSIFFCSKWQTGDQDDWMLLVYIYICKAFPKYIVKILYIYKLIMRRNLKSHVASNRKKLIIIIIITYK